MQFCMKTADLLAAAHASETLKIKQRFVDFGTECGRPVLDTALILGTPLHKTVPPLKKKKKQLYRGGV